MPSPSVSVDTSEPCFNPLHLRITPDVLVVNISSSPTLDNALIASILCANPVIWPQIEQSILEVLVDAHKIDSEILNFRDELPHALDVVFQIRLYPR